MSTIGRECPWQTRGICWTRRVISPGSETRYNPFVCSRWWAENFPHTSLHVWADALARWVRSASSFAVCSFCGKERYRHLKQDSLKERRDLNLARRLACHCVDRTWSNQNDIGHSVGHLNSWEPGGMSNTWFGQFWPSRMFVTNTDRTK